MAGCPECHISKGLFSVLKEKEGVWLCSINPIHRFTKDKEGYFHSVKI